MPRPADPLRPADDESPESQRLHARIEGMVRRLRPVCADLPESDFLALVERMARLQLKYELREDL